MLKERPVKSVEVSVFSHATEDEEKVKHAIKRLFTLEPELEVQKLSGHYGDPITLLTMKVSARKESTEILDRIWRRLSSLDRETLNMELDKHVDKSGNLYIRLNKQKAYNGKIVLQENDPIRIKFNLQIPHKADPILVIREHLSRIEDKEKYDQ